MIAAPDSIIANKKGDFAFPEKSPIAISICNIYGVVALTGEDPWEVTAG